MDRLILICDGGVHTLEYIHRHKVYPGVVVFDIGKFQEIIPYLRKDDEILLIIKGLTDFTMADIYALMNRFKENEDKIKNITILSNVNLGVIPYKYYFYEGDLFFGDVKLMENNEVYNLDKEGNIIEQKGKFLNIKKKEEKLSYNPIAHSYRRYKDSTVKVVFYGSKKENRAVKEEDNYAKNIILVDIYK